MKHSFSEAAVKTGLSSLKYAATAMKLLFHSEL